MNSNSAAMCAPSHRVCISCQSIAGMGKNGMGVGGVAGMVCWFPGTGQSWTGAGSLTGKPVRTRACSALCAPPSAFWLQVLYFEDFVFNHTTRGVYGYDFAFFLANQGASDGRGDRKSTRLNSSHVRISYAVS